MIRAVLLVAVAARGANAESGLIFRNGFTHELLAVDFDAATTINDVKPQLYELEEIPIDEQRLVYAGKGLLFKGHERIAAFDGDTVLLFRDVPPGERHAHLFWPLLDHELRKFAVWYDFNDGSHRMEYVNGTVAENQLNGKWVQTEPDGSTHEYAGWRLPPGPPSRPFVKKTTEDDDMTTYHFRDGAVQVEFVNGTTAAMAPRDGLGRYTHANGSVVVSYFKGDDVHTRVKTGFGGLAFQEFASNATVSFNASSPTYRAFVDRLGSSFHGMLDADTFRLVVADDFRVLALMSLVASSWLSYVYIVFVFLRAVAPRVYNKMSAAWWVSGPVRRRALDACRTWAGLLATLVCCAVGGSCLSALATETNMDVLGWCLDTLGALRNLFFVSERLCAPFKGADGVFDDNRRRRGELPSSRFDVGLLLRGALLATCIDPLLPLAKLLATELLWPMNIPASTRGWAAVAVRACLAVVGASLPGRLMSRYMYYGSAAHSIVITGFGLLVAFTIFPPYPVLCLLGAAELLVSVCCYFNDDGLLGVFASVVRGVLWPARVVNIGLNKTLDWDLGARIDAFGARVEAMCTRGARAFGKAASVDEDDESDDDARSEEPAPGGSERSGLTSFEESPKEPTGTLLADYWWLYALVAAAVFYWHVPPSFALWPPLASTWGCAVGLSHCFCVVLAAFFLWCLDSVCPFFIRWPVYATAVCGFPYLSYQLGGPVAAAWLVESYLQSAGWYAAHMLLFAHLIISLSRQEFASDTWFLNLVFTVVTFAGVCVLDGLGGRGRPHRRGRARLRRGENRRSDAAGRDRKPPGEPLLPHFDGADARAGARGRRLHVRPARNFCVARAREDDVALYRRATRSHAPNAEPPREEHDRGVPVVLEAWRCCCWRGEFSM